MKFKSKGNSFMNKIVFLVFITIAVFFLLISYSSYSPPSRKAFYEKASQIKQNFPSQNPRLWKVINGPFLHHLTHTDHNKPAVIFLGHKNQKETVDCFSAKLSKLYALKCGNNPVEIDGNQPMKSQKSLRETVENATNNGACAILIRDFDKIHPSSLMAFYHFADSELFTNVAFILTANVEDSFNDDDVSDHYKWSQKVSNYFTNLWREIDPKVMTIDRIKALLSRVTDLMAIIAKENDLSHC